MVNPQVPLNEIDDASKDSSDPGTNQLVSLFDSVAPSRAWPSAHPPSPDVIANKEESDDDY
jgi:hypothetical protein